MKIGEVEFEVKLYESLDSVCGQLTVSQGCAEMVITASGDSNEDAMQCALENCARLLKRCGHEVVPEWAKVCATCRSLSSAGEKIEGVMMEMSFCMRNNKPCMQGDSCDDWERGDL